VNKEVDLVNKDKDLVTLANGERKMSRKKDRKTKSGPFHGDLSNQFHSMPWCPSEHSEIITTQTSPSFSDTKDHQRIACSSLVHSSLAPLQEGDRWKGSFSMDQTI